MILHTVTLSRYVPLYSAYEHYTVTIARPYRLTYTGAARIIARQRTEETGIRWLPSDLHIVSIQSATYAR